MRQFLLGGLVWAIAAHAAATDNHPHRLEQHIEALKAEFFTVQHQRIRQQLASRYADAQYLDVYVALNIDGWVIESAELSLNGEAVTQAAYTPKQVTALLQGGWYRLLHRGLDRGEYALEARLRGRLSGSDDAVELHYSLAFQAADGPVEVLLEVGKLERIVTSAQRGASFPISIVYYDAVAEPARLLRRDCESPPPTDTDETRVREVGNGPGPCLAVAQYLLDVGRSHHALYELQALADHFGDERSWLLGRSYLQLGMRSAAERTLRTLSPEHPHFARAMLLLAELEYERGAPGRAVQRLTAHEDRVPDNLLADWQDLLTRALMQTGDVTQAIERLTALRSRKMTQFMRYNLGVALLQSGDIEAGMSLLRQVGRTRAGSENGSALHDRALLVAAQRAMEVGRYAEARALLRDVQLHGPYSNAAMLAMGWAHLTDTQVAVEASEPTEAALRVWAELVKRDPLEPAVQEALVGIPYLLTLHEHHAAAHNAYRRALSALEAAGLLMDQGIESLHDNRLIDTLAATGDRRAFGRDWRVEGLPDMPATYWLAMELARSAFQEGLRDYRDLGIMMQRLSAWSDARHAPLIARMAEARARQENVLRAKGLAPLKARRAIIAEHLARAQLGMIGLEERAALARD